MIKPNDVPDVQKWNDRR